MTSDQSVSFEDLFSDNGTFDERAVLQALHPLVVIQKDTNKIFLKDTKLNAQQKILAYSLAKKLLKYKGVIDSETITAIEVVRETGMKQGTVDPTFKVLRDDRILIGKIKYEIPGHQIFNVIKRLTSNHK